ncbi:MAG: DnaJ domain-containing protein [Candidatus Puniceispirillum sp.]
MTRSSIPDINLSDDDSPSHTRQCAAEGCMQEGIHRAPKSRDALRDYIWFCLDHVRAYNRAWNYYEGLHGAALEAEIRRATTWERPSWKFATGQPSDQAFDDVLELFDFEKRDGSKATRQLSKEERQAWRIMQLEPVNDIEIVKRQYKQLAKQNHPDKNRGDADAEERLKDINLAYALICKSIESGGKSAAQ